MASASLDTNFTATMALTWGYNSIKSRNNMESPSAKGLREDKGQQAMP